MCRTSCTRVSATEVTAHRASSTKAIAELASAHASLRRAGAASISGRRSMITASTGTEILQLCTCSVHPMCAQSRPRHWSHDRTVQGAGLEKLQRRDRRRAAVNADAPHLAPIRRSARGADDGIRTAAHRLQGGRSDVAWLLAVLALPSARCGLTVADMCGRDGDPMIPRRVMEPAPAGLGNDIARGRPPRAGRQYGYPAHIFYYSACATGRPRTRTSQGRRRTDGDWDRWANVDACRPFQTRWYTGVRVDWVGGSRS